MSDSDGVSSISTASLRHDDQAESNFTSLANVRNCERCERLHEKKEKFERCVLCEQAICINCHTTSQIAMPGCIMCYDCLEEHGEVWTTVMDSDSDTDAEAEYGTQDETEAKSLGPESDVPAIGAGGTAFPSIEPPEADADESSEYYEYYSDSEAEAERIRKKQAKLGASMWEAAEVDPVLVALFKELDTDNSGDHHHASIIIPYQIITRVAWGGWPGAGDLGRSEVSQMAERLGRPLAHDELEKAMGELDANGDGRVNLAEFAAWWQLQGKKRLGLMGALFGDARRNLGLGLRSKVPQLTNASSLPCYRQLLPRRARKSISARAEAMCRLVCCAVLCCVVGVVSVFCRSPQRRHT